MTNAEVLSAWLSGRPARSGNLSTDGRALKSYDLVIAKYGWHDESPIIFNYRGTMSLSITTSKHVTQAIKACEERNFEPKIINP